jgi:hypothetical protein
MPRTTTRKRSSGLNCGHTSPKPTTAKMNATRHNRSGRSRLSTRTIGLTRHKISCREPSVHGTQHTATTADAESVNRGLARGQLHRLVRWLHGRGDRVERRLCARETRRHDRCRNPTLLRRNSGTRVERKEGTRSVAPPPARCSRTAVRAEQRTNHRQRRGRTAAAAEKRTSYREPSAREQREKTWPQTQRSHHLTRHKISCREPSVHAAQDKAVMADSGSVNRGLARGQLHRLVRCC